MTACLCSCCMPPPCCLLLCCALPSPCKCCTVELAVASERARITAGEQCYCIFLAIPVVHKAVVFRYDKGRQGIAWPAGILLPRIAASAATDVHAAGAV